MSTTENPGKSRAHAIARLAVGSVSVGRIVIGATLLVRPRIMAGTWIGSDADSKGGRVLARAMGGRDIALGGIGLVALGEGFSVRPLLHLAIAADATDILATAVIRPRGTRLGLASLYTTAAFAIVSQAWAGQHLD